MQCSDRGSRNAALAALHPGCTPKGSQVDRVFTRVLDALQGLGLVEHASGVAKFTAFEGPVVALQRWAARFRATPALLELTARHRVPLQSAHKHFTFKYELPKQPLQKRKAKTANAYTRKQVRGTVMPIVHTKASQRLENDVRELNEFLSRQQIEGGVHQGYIRIFQNGDETGFNWNYGGRLYSQPAATNYQQMSKRARLKMTINGEAVAEIDIRASYLTLFYGWFGNTRLEFRPISASRIWRGRKRRREALDGGDVWQSKADHQMAHRTPGGIRGGPPQEAGPEAVSREAHAREGASKASLDGTLGSVTKRSYTHLGRPDVLGEHGDGLGDVGPYAGSRHPQLSCP